MSTNDTTTRRQEAIDRAERALAREKARAAVELRVLDALPPAAGNPHMIHPSSLYGATATVAYEGDPDPYVRNGVDVYGGYGTNWARALTAVTKLTGAQSAGRVEAATVLEFHVSVVAKKIRGTNRAVSPGYFLGFIQQVGKRKTKLF